MSASKNKLFLVIAISLFTISIAGCVTAGDERVNQASSQTLQTKFIKGKSTKTDVRNELGAPKLVAFTGSGDEQWTYYYQSINPIKTYGAMFTGGRIDVSKTIVILFDKRGILLNYSAE